MVEATTSQILEAKRYSNIKKEEEEEALKIIKNHKEISEGQPCLNFVPPPNNR
jgi:hypothetical protein